jgi:DNA-binding LacI/PurR family transcriptional regulator
MTKLSEYSPKYMQLARKVEQEIKSGRFSPGQALPTIRDFMTSGSLGCATVAKGLEVLEQQGLVKRHPQRGYFVAGQSPVKRKVSQIAFLTAALSGDTDLYVKGMTEALTGRSGFSVATYSTHADLNRYKELLQRVPDLEPAGVILMALSKKVMDIDLSNLANSGIPTVIIGEPTKGINCDRVVQSGEDSGRKLLQYLLGRGYRDFGVLLEKNTTDEGSAGFLRSVQCGLQTAGLELPEERVFYYENRHGWDNPPNPFIDGQEKMKELLARGLDFKVLLCRCDYNAVGPLRAMLNAGLKVPADLALASSVRCAVEGVSPMKLTTIDTRREEHSRVAVDLLIKRIEGYDGPPEVHHISGDLIVGETT